VVEIETVIVDSHKEVLPYWFREYQKLKSPLVEVRIDKHHDMSDECAALPAREGRQSLGYLEKIEPYLSYYTEREINEANFTCPAFHYGIIGALYHFNPRFETIDAYGRICGASFIDNPKTKQQRTMISGKRCFRLFWDERHTKLRVKGGKVIPVPEKLTIKEFEKDLSQSRFPLIIGFDLDSISAIDEKNLDEVTLSRRLDKSKEVLDCVPSPTFACIARSQTPRAYVPPPLVDRLQKMVISLIERAYS
jgi:hypothetical protein